MRSPFGMVSLSRTARAFALLALTYGCADETTLTDSLEIAHVETDLAQPRWLHVHGAAFPLATRGELTLRGVRAQPGRRARRITLHLPCQTLGPTHVRAELDEELLARAPLLFEGELTLRLHGAGVQAAGKRTSVTLRIPGSAEAELARAHEAFGLQHALGITELESTADGLTVASLAADGAAAQAGMRVGDRIVRANGSPVVLASDLTGGSDAEVLRLSILRSESGRVRARELVISGGMGASERARLALLGIACVVSALLLPAMRKLPSRPVPREARLLGPLAIVSLIVTCLLVRQELDFRLLWLVPAGLHLLALALAYTKRGLSSAALSEEALSLALGTLAVAALREAAHVVDQGVPPWQWALSCMPPCWLAGVVLGQTGPDLCARAGQRKGGLLAITGPWLSWARAATLASFALGGGLLPSDLDLSDRTLAWLGALVLLAKVALAHALLAQSARLRPTVPTTLLLALAAPLSALAWSLLIAPSVASMLGVVSTGLAAGCIARTLAARVGRRELARDPALSPFL